MGLWDSIQKIGASILPESGNQINSSVMSQMSQQAGPSQAPAIPFYLRSQDPQASQRPSQKFPAVVAPPPKPIPIMSISAPETATPTSSSIGGMPKELVPSQPSLSSSQKMESELDQFKKTVGMQQAAGGINLDALKAGLRQYADAQTGVNLTPFAALSDAWFGGNLSQAAKATAPDTQEHRLEKLQDMREKLANLQNASTKQELDAAKSSLAQLGYAQNREAKIDVAKINAAAKNSGPQAQRIGLQEDRLAAQAIDKIHNDSIIKKNVTTMQQVERGRHTLENADVLTPQIFSEIEQDLARAISGGGQTAVSTIEKSEFNSLNRELTMLKQRVTNKPQDINSPEVKDILSKTMNRLEHAFRNNSYQRAKTRATGAAKAYSHSPNALGAMTDAVESYNPANMQGDAVDQEAIDWARQNPDHPRSAEILNLHGGQ